jgi:hypothetical protein
MGFSDRDRRANSQPYCNNIGNGYSYSYSYCRAEV